MKTKSEDRRAKSGKKPAGFTMAMGTAQWESLVANAQAAASPGWRTPKGEAKVEADKGATGQSKKLRPELPAQAGQPNAGLGVHKRAKLAPSLSAPTTGLQPADALCPPPEEFARAFAEALAELRALPAHEEYERCVGHLGHISVNVVLRRN